MADGWQALDARNEQKKKEKTAFLGGFLFCNSCSVMGSLDNVINGKKWHRSRCNSLPKLCNMGMAPGEYNRIPCKNNITY